MIAGNNVLIVLTTIGIVKFLDKDETGFLTYTLPIFIVYDIVGALFTHFSNSQLM